MLLYMRVRTLQALDILLFFAVFSLLYSEIRLFEVLSTCIFNKRKERKKTAFEFKKKKKKKL